MPPPTPDTTPTWLAPLVSAIAGAVALVLGAAASSYQTIRAGWRDQHEMDQREREMDQRERAAMHQELDAWRLRCREAEALTRAAQARVLQLERIIVRANLDLPPDPSAGGAP